MESDGHIVIVVRDLDAKNVRTYCTYLPGIWVCGDCHPNIFVKSEQAMKAQIELKKIALRYLVVRQNLRAFYLSNPTRFFGELPYYIMNNEIMLSIFERYF